MSASAATDAAPSYPVRVGAIDMGTNATRFMAAEFTTPSSWTTRADVRYPLRLGHDVFRTGELSREAIDSAPDVLGACRQRLDQLGVSRYRAVATSALRESRNARVLVRRAAKEHGIRIEVITGLEEARLVHLAVRSRFDLSRGAWALADLGGGSVEVSIADDRGVMWSATQPIGAVRLLEELSGVEADPDRYRRLMEEYAARARLDVLGDVAASGLVATGGNAEALAVLCGAGTIDNSVHVITLESLHDIIDALADMSVAERIDRWGLKPDRADVVLPAALVYERLALTVGVSEIVVPHVGLKEGVLLDLVDDAVTHASHEDRLEHVTWEGALALGRRYAFEEAHGVHVARLAVSLFDQLTDVHGLDAADRRLLRAAAVLHDIGIQIAYKRHHKHSFYLVSQSELPGFSPEDAYLIGLIARFHRKSEPSDQHVEYMQVEEVDRRRVAMMASLLRVADALDREHLQRVRAVRVEQRDGVLDLHLDGDGDLLLERWAVQRKAGLLKKTLGMPVAIAGEVVVQ